MRGNECIPGVVYTPEDVGEQLVRLMLSEHLRALDPPPIAADRFIRCFEAVMRPNDADETVFQGELPGLQAFGRMLCTLDILDIACGTGNLLLAYAAFLERLLRRLWPSEAGERMQSVVRERLHGIDVDARACEVCKCRIEEAFGAVPMQILCGDALTLAFDRQFDLIIGNPPYIGEKGNKDHFEAIRKTDFGRRYYAAKMDMFYYFIYRGYALLNPGGTLCFVTTRYFLTADSAKGLRDFLRHTFFMSAYMDYGDRQIFPGRNLHCAAYTLKREPSERVYMYSEAGIPGARLLQDALYDAGGTIHFTSDGIQRETLIQMRENAHSTLGEGYAVRQGLVTGMDRAHASGVFVYTAHESLEVPEALRAYLRPLYKNSDIHAGDVEAPSRFVLYADHVAGGDLELANFLAPHKERLAMRREVRTGRRHWYQITWPRCTALFETPSVVVPHRAPSNRFAYVTPPFYASADVYYIKETPSSPYPLSVLALILNAPLYYTWLFHRGKRKGQLLELYATPLKEVPLPNLDAEAVSELIALSELSTADLTDTLRRVNAILCKAFEIASK